MAKISKATKKFQQKHLKTAIENRRAVQKHKKAVERRKGKSKPATEEEHVPKSRKEVFDDMSVDQFFEGGFEMPNPKKGVKIDDVELEDSDSGSAGEPSNGDSSEDESDKGDDSDDSSSEEEDEETMRKNLENLAETDPEFHKYLQANDLGLLNFEAEDEDSTTQIKVTKQLLTQWREELAKPNVELVETIVKAFGSTTNNADEDNAYRVTDEGLFMDLIFLGLKELPEALQKLAPFDVSGNKRKVKATKTFADLEAPLKSLAKGYKSLLQDIDNTETVALVLSSIQEVLPYYMSNKRALKDIFKATVALWATTSDVQTQIAAYAFLNNAAREFPDVALEPILRASYSSFLKACRRTNVRTLDLINFSKNSAVELFGIDETLSYKVGFEYIRQLAVHLRNTLSGKLTGKDAHTSVYNWQFCHSLDFWSRVLAQHCNPENELKHKSKELPLRSLIYPLVQVTLGTIRLVPTAQYFPLRFYLTRSLLRLAQGLGVYIPLYPILAEVLTSSAITKPARGGQLPAVEYEYLIKVSQQHLGKKVYQTSLCEQFIELVSEFFALYCKSVAFPELVTPVILLLRRYIKRLIIPRFSKQLQQLVERLNANSTYILQQRAKIPYGPTNKSAVLNFLKETEWLSTPLGTYVAAARKAREETKKMLTEAARQEEGDGKDYMGMGSDSE